MNVLSTKMEHTKTYDAEAIKKLSDMELIDILTAKIRRNIESYCGAPSGSTLVNGRPFGGQELSRMFKFEVASGKERRDFFIKLCPVFESLNPAESEYRTLKLLHGRMPEGFGVARPIDFFPELNSYAMESVGKADFKSRLLKANSRFRGEAATIDLHYNVAGCAKWLNAFHSLTSSGDKAFDFGLFMKAIEEDFDYRTLGSYGFKKETLSLLDSAMDGLASLKGELLMPCAAWHWDYTPAHVFLDRGMITVIDILGKGNTPVYEDVGHFLASLSTVNNLPFHPFFDFEFASSGLRQTFVNNYFGAIAPDMRLFTNAYTLKYLILWFWGQYKRVGDKVHPLAASVFSKTRLSRLFEAPMARSAQEIISTVKELG